MNPEPVPRSRRRLILPAALLLFCCLCLTPYHEIRLFVDEAIWGERPYTVEVELLRDFARDVGRFRAEDWDRDGLPDLPQSLDEMSYRGGSWEFQWGGAPPGWPLCQHDRNVCVPCDLPFGPFEAENLRRIPPVDPATLGRPPCSCGPTCRLGSDPDLLAHWLGLGPLHAGQGLDGLYYLPFGDRWRAWWMRPIAMGGQIAFSGATFYVDDTLVIRYALDAVAGPDSPPVWAVDQP